MPNDKPKSSPILVAENLYKSYDKGATHWVLHGVTLSVAPGESVAITGASGEGKTTLLQLIGGLDTPDAGRILIDGVEITKSKAARLRNEKLGFIFQDFHLLDDYDLLSNVLMPARIGRQATGSNSPARQRALRLLAGLGLSNQIHQSVRHLSGGERQRVGIARALCNDPSLLLADEPTGNLDGANSRVIHDLLLSFVKDHERGLVIVTHDPELAALCDRTYHLQDGQLSAVIR